jgi:hypothetical protein
VKRKNVILISLLSVVVAVWGASVAFNRKVDFDVVLLNRETEPVHDVRVHFEDFRFRFGDLEKRAGELGQRKFLMQYGPWPKEVNVAWREGGRESAVVRSVLPVPPGLSVGRNEQLELVIEFKEDGPVAYPRVKESFKEKGLSYRYKD